MAPTARIVAYYIRDDGEIVADSIGFDVEGVFLNKVNRQLVRAVANQNIKRLYYSKKTTIDNQLDNLYVHIT